MPGLMLMMVLSVPGPIDARTISYDVARLPPARALELQGRPRRYRVILDSLPGRRRPDRQLRRGSPVGLPATMRLPALPIGHEYPDEFEVEGTLEVIHHPAREINGPFVEYRLVGRMVRPVSAVEG
jgi:hypothetical protein